MTVNSLTVHRNNAMHKRENSFHKTEKHKEEIKELHETKLRRLNSLCIFAFIGKQWTESLEALHAHAWSLYLKQSTKTVCIQNRKVNLENIILI